MPKLVKDGLEGEGCLESDLDLDAGVATMKKSERESASCTKNEGSVKYCKHMQEERRTYGYEKEKKCALLFLEVEGGATSGFPSVRAALGEITLCKETNKQKNRAASWRMALLCFPEICMSLFAHIHSAHKRRKERCSRLIYPLLSLGEKKKGEQRRRRVNCIASQIEKNCCKNQYQKNRAKKE